MGGGKIANGPLCKSEPDGEADKPGPGQEVGGDAKTLDGRSKTRGSE